MLRRPLALSVGLSLAACGPAGAPGELGPVERTETNEFGIVTCTEATATRTCATHRAILGVSMGASGAGQLGLGHPELFDAVGMLGISLVDWVYMMRLLTRYHLGGFCDRETILRGLAHVNDPARAPFCGPVKGEERLESTGRLKEADQSYNHWYRWIDNGRGGNFGRNKLRESFQDIALAYGNAFYHNPESPYFPPGVPLDYRSRPNPCKDPIVLKGVHHREYNPDGAYDVIPACDTNTNGGDFDPARPADAPVEILLAVDYNGNGRRDYAEPVITFVAERWLDAGILSNDQYDFEWNPRGTRGNFRYDLGERFLDHGLDGVPDTHDYGEGNGRFDYNPKVERFLDQNPRDLIEEMPEGHLERLHIWADAGIRDFLMSAGGTNWMWGALQSRVGSRARVYESFPSLTPGAPRFEAADVDFSEAAIGRHVYVRYGSVDAPEAEIAEGDGHHVGTVKQVLDRFTSALSFVQSRFADRDDLAVDAVIDHRELVREVEFESAALGRTWRYGLVLPPGYHAPENQGRRYPVVYFLHGQGQESQHLLAASLLFFGFMADGTRPERTDRGRADWAKFIIVFPESSCPDDGECRTGTFNTNHLGLDGEGPKYGDVFFELMREIETKYRVAVPVELPAERP